MKPAEQPGDLQLAILRVLWEQGEASVAGVQEALAGSERDLATTTIATVLSRMEKKGMVEHRNEGRQYIYRALVSEDEVRRSTLDQVTASLFAGDVAELVNTLLKGPDVAPGDLDRVKQMLDAHRRKGGASRAR